MPDVRTFTAAGQLVVEVDADPGTTLDPIFRARFATEARTAPAAFYTVTPGHCAARVPADRGGDLLAVVARLTPAEEVRA